MTAETSARLLSLRRAVTNGVGAAAFRPLVSSQRDGRRVQQKLRPRQLGAPTPKGPRPATFDDVLQELRGGEQPPTEQGHTTSEGVRADVHMSEAGPSSAAGHATPEGARADVRMSEAGPSSEAGHATPEGARADGAATPTRTADTQHMHSVASTAKRQRGTQLGRNARRRAAKHARAGRAADDG